MIRKWRTARTRLRGRLQVCIIGCVALFAYCRLQPSLTSLAVVANVNINNLSSARLSRDRSNQSRAPFLG